MCTRIEKVPLASLCQDCVFSTWNQWSVCQNQVGCWKLCPMSSNIKHPDVEPSHGCARWINRSVRVMWIPNHSMEVRPVTWRFRLSQCIVCMQIEDIYYTYVYLYYIYIDWWLQSIIVIQNLSFVAPNSFDSEVKAVPRRQDPVEVLNPNPASTRGLGCIRLKFPFSSYPRFGWDQVRISCILLSFSCFFFQFFWFDGCFCCLAFVIFFQVTYHLHLIAKKPCQKTEGLASLDWLYQQLWQLWPG